MHPLNLCIFSVIQSIRSVRAFFELIDLCESCTTKVNSITKEKQTVTHPILMNQTQCQVIERQVENETECTSVENY